jgi:hypothetical protein
MRLVSFITLKELYNTLMNTTVSRMDNQIIADVPEILPDSESEDEQIPEINEFLSWQMPDDPDDDDVDPEEQEENFQKELINSDEFSSFTPIDSEQPSPPIFTKRLKREKQ